MLAFGLNGVQLMEYLRNPVKIIVHEAFLDAGMAWHGILNERWFFMFLIALKDDCRPEMLLESRILQ